MLLRHHKKPQNIGSELDKVARRFLPLALFLLATSQFFFIYELSDGKNWSVIIPFVAILIYFTVPLHLIERNLKIFNVVRSDNDSYSKNIEKFEHNYKKDNPVHFQVIDGMLKMNAKHLLAYGATTDPDKRALLLKDLFKFDFIFAVVAKNKEEREERERKRIEKEEEEEEEKKTDKHLLKESSIEKRETSAGKLIGTIFLL